MAFRPYTDEEIRDAAEAYGVDPNFALSIYAVESSRGTDPQALKTRSVKTKHGTTFVRGPFQLEDATTNDLLRRQKLTGVNIDDPDVHLDLAMRVMRELQDRYNGDKNKMFQAYLGFGTDELGTTSQSYADKGMAEYRRLGGDTPPATPVAAPALPDVFAGNAGAAATPADDLFGIPAMPAIPADTRPVMSSGMVGDLSRLSQVPRDPLGLPMNITAATQPHPMQGPSDMDAWIQKLVDEELQGRDYATG